ncbi:MAG: hypothetical protein ACE5I1_24590 [bacterium]
MFYVVMHSWTLRVHLADIYFPYFRVDPDGAKRRRLHFQRKALERDKIEVKAKNSMKSLVFLLAFGVLAACVQNPFGSDDISPPRSQLRGTVELNDRSNPEGTYIWLDGLNVGTYADRNGAFSLRLPPKAAQGSEKGANGVFQLYFYSGNFRTQTATVAIQNGEFAFGNADLSDDGEIRERKKLIKILDISTDASIVPIGERYAGDLLVQVVLSPVLPSVPVTVVFPELFESGVGRVFVRKPGSKDEVIWNSSAFAILQQSSVQVVERNPISLTMRFSASLRDALAGGEYEIIPYLLVKHPEIPENLLETLVPDLEHNLKVYLNIPFSRKNGRLIVEG